MMQFIFVFLGAGIGGVLRYSVGLISNTGSSSFPWVTLCINIIGSLCLGTLAGAIQKDNSLLQPYYSLLGIGLCGGFTTFSAFALESLSMIQRQAYVQALIYILVSVIGSVFLCGAGYAWVSK